MTNNKLEKIYQNLELQRSWFIEKSGSLDRSALDIPLGKDEWSFTQIIEHLVLAESNLLNLIKNASLPNKKVGIINKFKAFIVRLVLKNGIKVPVPTESVLPKSNKSLDELLLEWQSIRDEMIKVFTAVKDETLFTFEHPIAGPLDICETAEFIGLHLRYHQVRLDKLLKNIKSS